MINKKALGYDKVENFLGVVSAIDFVKDTVELSVIEDNGEVTSISSDMNNVEFLYEAFVLRESAIFDKDVLDIGGSLYMIELHKDGDITLHTLGEDLDILASGEKTTLNEEVLDLMEHVAELVGNYYEMKDQLEAETEAKNNEDRDFNIKVVKEFDGQDLTYFYACNNKEKNEVDLIKVIFIGHHLIEEDAYERRTLSMDVFLDSINSGTVIEVSQQELMNYAIGKTYGTDSHIGKTAYTAKSSIVLEEADFDCDGNCYGCECHYHEEEFECGVNCDCTYECVEDMEEEGTDLCMDCGKELEDCHCDLW